MKEMFNLEDDKRNWITIDGDTAEVHESFKSDEIGDWKRLSPKAASKYRRKEMIGPTSADVEMSARLTFAAVSVRYLIEIDPKKYGGVPVLAGTRFKVSQILAEIADGKSVKKLSKDFNLDAFKVSQVLHAIAIYLDRKITR